MRVGRGYGLVLALVFSVTLGAPVALSGVDAPVATTALSLLVDDAAAQFETTIDETLTGEDCGIDSTNCFVTDNEGGDGGGATSSSGRGGNGGLAILHEAITTSAASETSQSLSDSPTGDIHIEVTNNVEPTDETVVILNAGIFGSTGNQQVSGGAASQSINTGSNTGSAEASGGDSGDATATGGDGGSSDIGDISQVDIVIPLLSNGPTGPIGPGG